SDNTSAPVNNNEPPQSNSDNNTTVASNGSLAIPRNTILALELLTPVSTDASQRGDRIQAKVVEPAQYAGYMVDGRVSAIQRPGKVKGIAKLQLSFDQISSTDNRSVQLHAELIEISPMGGEYD